MFLNFCHMIDTSTDRPEHIMFIRQRKAKRCILNAHTRVCVRGLVCHAPVFNGFRESISNI